MVVGTLGGTGQGGGWRFGADEAAAGQLIAGALGCGGGPDDNDARGGRLVAFGGNNTAGPIDVAACLNAHGGGSRRMDFESETFVAATLRARGGARGVDSDCADTLIAHILRGEGFDASEDGTGRGTPIIAAPLVVPTMATEGDGLLAFDTTQITSPCNRSNPQPGGMAPTLSKESHAPAIAYQCHGSNVGKMGTLRAGNGNEAGGVPFVGFNTRQDPISSDGVSMPIGAKDNGGGVAGPSMAVRRLTPRECERLQGFPDDWTRVPNYRAKVNDRSRMFARFAHANGMTGDQAHQEIADYYGIGRDELRSVGVTPDGPRYKACGNSKAVVVVQWIGRRLAHVDSLVRRREGAP